MRKPSLPDRTDGVCVIMAGGRGTRFWPLSRLGRPKQLLPLGRRGSLLRETYERVASLVGADRVLVITQAAQAAATAAELPELDPRQIVAEPSGRNTAACAALGAALAGRLAPGSPLALLPADHLIGDDRVFRAQLRRAFGLAAAGAEVVTLGVPPLRPATGYGYIETAPGDGGGELRGLRFVEKPDAATAARFLAAGNHLWNSGVFVWNAGGFARALAAHAPQLSGRMDAAAAAWGGPGFDAALAAAYADCPALSVDVAVMEKLRDFPVIPAEFAWSDLGSWDTWREHAPDLGDGNRGVARAVVGDGGGHTVHAPGKAVVLLGVDDLIVVDTRDALLICRTGAAQQIKEITDRLAAQGDDDLL
jgi:mannose-1-phosphate guanylyltransferase